MAHSLSQHLFTLGLILILGHFAAKTANLLRLPHVSGYILAGLLLSPSITGILSQEQISVLFGFTSEMALSIIAYSIGGSLQMSRIRGLGREIVWINISEGLGAFFCTFITVYATWRILQLPGNEESIRIALLIGGISVATAPAATLAVIHELRAKGPLTTTLLGVVALDDALSIIIFSAAFAFANHLSGPGMAGNSPFFAGLVQIGGSLMVGLLAGFSVSAFLDSANRPETNLMLSLGTIFLVSGLAGHFSFSPLLANMVMGFVVINRVRHADDLFHQLDIVEETIFCLFFSLAVAHFDIEVLSTSAMLGVILLCGRFAGKLSGTYIGGKLSHAPPKIYRNLGFTLLPQAGISLGLVFLTRPILPAQIFDVVLSAILASIILNEIISPPVVKWTLHRAGETNPDG